MTTTQTATAPANAQPPAGAAATPAKKADLDEFLREFDNAAPPAKPAATAAAAPAATAMPPAATVPTELVEKVNRLEARDQEYQRRELAADIDRIVDTVRNASDFLKGVDSDVVHGYLQGLGAKNPAFRQAFMQRQQKPEAWSKLLKAVGEQLEEKLKPIATTQPSAQGRAAVIAASRQMAAAPVTTGEKSPEEVRRMNDREFAAYKRQIAGRRRSA